MKRLVSIVVPVYNEADNVRELYRAVSEVLKNLPYEREFVFVDDGSSDGSDIQVEQLAKDDPRVKFLQFSRNFGQQAATSAGIMHASGDAVITMDADLQHPPRLIPEFLRVWEEGAEVVIGVRNPRKDQSIARRIGTHLFFRLMNAISEAETMVNASDFRLLDRKVADAFSKLTERRRLTRALIDWLGFKRTYVRFDVDDRFSGRTHYTYSQLLTLAFSSIIAHSRLPLYAASVLGIAITLIAGALGLFILVEQVVLGDPLQFDVSPIGMLAVMLLFLNGVVLISLGLLSAYVAAVREEVIGRPFFVVRKTLNFEHAR